MRRWLILGAVLLAALLGLILWDTPEAPAAVSPVFHSEYREDTAHYLTKEGELIP